MTDATPGWLRLADGHHLHPAGDGSWGLLDEPVARGWVAGPLTEDDLVRRPLPLA